MANQIDLNLHPLASFFREICIEYDRGREIPWGHISHASQHRAIEHEHNEWLAAYCEGNVNGKHGERNKLIQMANACGKRYELLPTNALDMVIKYCQWG